MKAAGARPNLPAPASAPIETPLVVAPARDSDRRLQALTEIGRLITLGLEESPILQHAAEAVARLLEAPFVGLWLLDPDRGDLVVAATAGPLRDGLEAGFRRPPAVRTLNRVVLESGRLFQTDEVEAHPAWMNHAFTRQHGLKSYLGVPLTVRDQPYGILAILFRERLTLGQQDLELVEAIAGQAAAALSNARLYQQAQRRAEEATAVAQVGRAINASLELQAVLDLIVEQACRLIGTSRSALAIAENAEGGPIYRFVARHGLSPEFPRRIQPRDPRDGTTAMAISERRPVWSADLLSDPSFTLSDTTREGVVGEGYRSVLSVPLLVGDATLGALVVYRDEAGRFSEDQVRLLGVFADQAASAIQNARAFQREQARRRQLEAVRDVTAELTRELGLTTLLDLILRRAGGLVEASAGGVYLWDEAAEELVPRAWRGVGPWMSGIRCKLGEGAAGLAAERRTGVTLNNYPRSPHAHPLVVARSRLKSVLAEPVLYQDRLIGAIVLGRYDELPFSDQDAELLRLFADQAAIAIENARLFEQAAKAEALGELARLKAEFLGTVSHELRTPLWLVQGYAEMLAQHGKKLSAAEVETMTAEIQRGAATMVRLVDDLLDFSRTEQGRLVLRRRRVSIVEAARQVVDTFSSLPGGERITARLPRALEAEVDPDRFTQIVSNLLTNALRYAPGGPVVVSLTRRGGQLRVEVADTGPGIRPEEHERIWEKFYRGVQELNSPNRGTGLGLSVVKHLVELHGGQVGVRSVPGQGATFWFTLPLVAPQAPRPTTRRRS